MNPTHEALFAADYLDDVEASAYGCGCEDLVQRLYGDQSTNPNRITVYVNGIRQD